MFKSIKAVAVSAVAAVSLFVAVPSTHAYWDYFEVIEEGSAEAKVTAGIGDDEGTGVKVRFGIMPNLEIMATNESPFGMNSDFSLGARYQVLPEMLAVGLDLGIPTRDNGAADFGIAPSVQFHMGINDMISVGAGLGLGIDINRFDSVDVAKEEIVTEMYMNLEFGFEVGLQLTENFGAWLGVDFAMDLSYDKDRHDDCTYENEGDMVIMPGFGIFYTAGNITVGADFGLDLYRTSRERNRLGMFNKGTKEGEAMGLTAGVNFSVAF